MDQHGSTKSYHWCSKHSKHIQSCSFLRIHVAIEVVMLDLFAKTQIRIVSSFLSDGCAHLKCRMIWFPARIRNHNSYGNPGLPYPQSWRQTKWSWNPQCPGLAVTAHRWPGVGRMPGVPSTGPMLFNALATSVAIMLLGECKPRTLGGSFHP